MKVVKVRKDHNCATCDKVIKKGTKAKVLTERLLRVSVGTYYETLYFHLNCKVTRTGEIV